MKQLICYEPDRCNLGHRFFRSTTSRCGPQIYALTLSVRRVSFLRFLVLLSLLPALDTASCRQRAQLATPIPLPFRSRLILPLPYLTLHDPNVLLILDGRPPSILLPLPPPSRPPPLHPWRPQQPANNRQKRARRMCPRPPPFLHLPNVVCPTRIKIAECIVPPAHPRVTLPIPRWRAAPPRANFQGSTSPRIPHRRRNVRGL